MALIKKITKKISITLMGVAYRLKENYILRLIISGDWIDITIKIILLIRIGSLLFNILDYYVLSNIWDYYVIHNMDEKDNTNNNTVNNNNTIINKYSMGGDISKTIRYTATFAPALKIKNPRLKAGFIAAGLLFNGGLDLFGYEEFRKKFFKNNLNPMDDSSSRNTYIDFLELILDLFPIADHTMSLETLKLKTRYIILNIFLMTMLIIIFMIYFFINLFILYNKDWILSKVKNKYLLMYVKYVIIRTKVDIFIVGIGILFYISFIAYSLYYLIIHPII